MIVVFLASCRGVLLRNVEEHGVGDANLARELENVRELYRGMIVVYVVMGFAARAV